MDEGLAGRLVQLGIRTLNAEQAEPARRFGVEIVAPDDVDAGYILYSVISPPSP